VNSAHVLRRLVPSEWGGIETVVTQLCRGLRGEGVSSEILCTEALSRRGVDTVEGLSVRRFPYDYCRFPPRPAQRAALDKKGGNPFCPGLFAYLATTPGLDIVACHTAGRLAGVVRAAAKLRKIPYVVTLHGGHFAVPPSELRGFTEVARGSVDLGRPLDWLLGTRAWLRDAAAVVALSPAEAAAARSALPEQRVVELPNGVDVARFSAPQPEAAAALRAKLGVAPHHALILCVARIDRQKGQDLLLEATARLGPHVHLAFAGPATEPAFAAALRERAAASDMGRRVHFLGALPFGGPELPAAYAAADAVALASRHEPFGVVLLEAMAARRPVVAFAVGGVPSFVTDSVTGLLAQEGNVDQLAEKLAAALRLGPSAPMIDAAFEAVRTQFDWSVVARRMAGLFSELVRRA
jgi:glycosyltransferase involved in cell wall biosynthesis